MWRRKKRGWRPKNWDIMQSFSPEEQMESPLDAMKFYEAGADAMLEALFNQVGEHKETNGILWFGKTDNDDLLIYTNIIPEETNEI